MNFPTRYAEILNRVDAVKPLEYSKTRNFTNGDVTYLSPYISRGVISVKQVLDAILARGYNTTDAVVFIKELAWREYFQRSWQYLEDGIFNDIRHCYTGIKHNKIPTAVIEANTGIQAIDKAIEILYQTGYMHNHLRMYLASITCTIGKAHWQMPSQWMYYHLLDGDLASNSCSWQWVAGTFSSRQYFCNQENINKYTGTVQQQTFLDKSYDELPKLEIPEQLRSTTTVPLKTSLPEKVIPVLDSSLPLVIYTAYNLSPVWRQDIQANRVLLLEPSHYKQHPVSEQVISFILDLARNINGLQVMVGEVNEIPQLNQFPVIYSKEHPAFNHLPGKKDERDWLFPEVKGFHNSFFSFWKKCLPYLREMENSIPAMARA